MILTEEFLVFLIEANKLSPSICGQLFIYDNNENRIKCFDKSSAKDGFKWRSKLFLFIAAEMIFRILDRKLNFTHQLYTANTRVEIRMCMIMFLPCLVVAERYRVRSKFSEDFTSFFNGIIQMETTHGKGLKWEKDLKIKCAKLFFILTHFVCKWLVALPLSISCTLMTSLPLNTIWIVEHTFVLAQCTTLTGTLIWKGITFIANYCAWKIAAVQGYNMVTDIVVGVLSLSSCQEIAYEKLSRALDRPNKAKNRCGIQIFPEIIICRSVYLLVKQYNKMMRTLLFLMLITCGTTEVISATNIIHQTSSFYVPIPLKVFFSVASIQTGITILVAFGFAGDFYKESYESLASLQRRNRNAKAYRSQQEKKYRKAFLDSCQVQKIQF